MQLATFASGREFRKWLESNYQSANELLVRCYKGGARNKGLTYREALDEALCFGWIDGVRQAVDEESFSTRFTPRKARSKRKPAGRAHRLLGAGRADQAPRPPAPALTI
jgi:uncharacterized protein YdeI (YjbR/CyaY-like superfamily)